MPPSDKAEGAFRTIGEVAAQLGLPQHILRYWETRFPQLKPLQRAGNRRYYRPADVALAQRINRLLNIEGYTVRGVQQMLAGRPADALPASPPPAIAKSGEGDSMRALRDDLAMALVEDTRMRI